MESDFGNNPRIFGYSSILTPFFETQFVKNPRLSHRNPFFRQTLANRFRKHGESYLRFITTPGVEPTNNLAEQAIRFVVIDRKITQGTRSEKGQRWLERIWTMMATCAQTGRSVCAFLQDSLSAYFGGEANPSLLPDST